MCVGVCGSNMCSTAKQLTRFAPSLSCSQYSSPIWVARITSKTMPWARSFHAGRGGCETRGVEQIALSISKTMKLLRRFFPACHESCDQFLHASIAVLFSICWLKVKQPQLVCVVVTLPHNFWCFHSNFCLKTRTKTISTALRRLRIGAIARDVIIVILLHWMCACRCQRHSSAAPLRRKISLARSRSMEIGELRRKCLKKFHAELRGGRVVLWWVRLMKFGKFSFNKWNFFQSFGMRTITWC